GNLPLRPMPRRSALGGGAARIVLGLAQVGAGDRGGGGAGGVPGRLGVRPLGRASCRDRLVRDRLGLGELLDRAANLVAHELPERTALCVLAVLPWRLLQVWW